MIGCLGGFIYHPKKGNMPGVETLWKGMMRMRDFATAWNAYRDSA
jgi:hypothetical protein